MEVLNPSQGEPTDAEREFEEHPGFEAFGATAESHFAALMKDAVDDFGRSGRLRQIVAERGKRRSNFGGGGSHY